MVDYRNDRSEEAKSFAEQADGKGPGLVQEFVQFVWENKLWWITPIVLTLVLLGVLLLLTSGSSPVAPFIYTLF